MTLQHRHYLFMDYQHYTEEDFITDESFINWVFKRNTPDSTFWDDWTAAHPAKAEMVENARRFLLHLQIRENTFTEADTHHDWQAVKVAIQSQPTILRKHPAVSQPVSVFRHWQKLAAVLIGLLLVASVYFLQQNKRIEYTTTYGETQSVTLPDGSTVVLNANSSLSYENNWDTKSSRDIWLEGEAFLHVEKKPGATNARFIVHTRKLNVEVLGTAFNVNSRHGKTKVVLSSGKVQLTTAETDAKQIMQPGEMVEFSEDKQVFTKKQVNPDTYSAWRNNKLIFSDTSVQEIAQLLEDNYGLQVLIQDAALSKRTLTGEIASTDEEVVLEALAESLDISIDKEGRTLRLKNK